jgi:ubiquitin-like protein ATG12
MPTDVRVVSGAARRRICCAGNSYVLKVINRNLGTLDTLTQHSFVSLGLTSRKEAHNWHPWDTPPAARGMAQADAKVIVHFRHAGNAPILAAGHQKFKVPADARFSTVIELLRSKLGKALGSDEPLVSALSHACVPIAKPSELGYRLSQFLFCNQAFAPPPDELMADLAACFSVNMSGQQVLVLNYATTPAWG